MPKKAPERFWLCRDTAIRAGMYSLFVGENEPVPHSSGVWHGWVEGATALTPGGTLCSILARWHRGEHPGWHPRLLKGQGPVELEPLRRKGK